MLCNSIPWDPLLLLEFGPLLLGQPRFFGLDLVRSSHSNVLGPEVAESGLQYFLNNVAANVVNDHDGGHGDLEVKGERHELELLVQLGDEFRGAREGNERYPNEPPVHASIFSNTLSERAALVVDGKRGNLLDELEQINRTVEE